MGRTLRSGGGGGDDAWNRSRGDLHGRPERAGSPGRNWTARAGWDADALAAALLQILKDRRLAEDMGARGRDVALSQFRQELVVDRFEELYTRLVLPRTAEG